MSAGTTAARKAIDAAGIRSIMSHRAVVIFDLDGTLTKPYLDFDVVREEIGVQGPILEAIETMEGPRRRRAESILARYEREAAHNAQLQDGAIEVIAMCRANGLATAILTRNSRVSLAAVLNKHGIVVDTSRTREDGAIKPSAEPVLSICEELGADPRRSWLVGDYLFDILSGESAGTRTVLMVGDRPLPDYASRADHVIRRLSELPKIIERP